MLFRVNMALQESQETRGTQETR